MKRRTSLYYAGLWILVSIGLTAAALLILADLIWIFHA